MKKINFTLLLFLLSFLIAKAQINLVGASANPNGTIDIVKWQALDSSSVTAYPSGLEAYLFASSVFDSYNSNYYLGGIASGSGVLLSFNTNSNIPSLIPYAAMSNISEIDMSTGKIYNLSSDSVGYISVNEYDISTGSDSLLGIIVEPGVNGIVADAIGFNSNEGIIYYIGFDGSQNNCLYEIPVRNPVFSWTKTILLTTAIGNNFSSVNYDNVKNILYASNAEYNSSGNYTGNKVVEINTTTGELIERGLLAGFPYYLAGSSSFDQNSGSFLLVGFDSAFNERMIVFNTQDNTYTTGYVPATVSEIVCDNYSFARSAYITTSIREQDKSDFTIFPNPATSKFILNMSESAHNSTFRIYDMNGKECLSTHIQHPETEISTISLTKGVYMVTLQNQNSIQTKKLIIQ
ncbi:MAG: T9SS type A sorting domain-containing protein [Bacteroidetes bacterium]|nr:T9SS type A sorting domain-containing protein [Bacteroidota bacterium]